MPERLKILVTSGDWQAAVNCVQSFGKSGHEVHVVGETKEWSLSRSKYCSKFHVGPSEFRPQQYDEFLGNVIAEGNYDVLVPISDRAVDFIVDNREELITRIAFALPETKTIELARNKADTTKLAMESGIPVPGSVFPEKPEAFPSMAGEVEFPCVVKKPTGTNSDGVYIVADSSQFHKLTEDISTDDQLPFVQEFIGGDLYDVTAVCDHGKIVSIFGFRVPQKYLIGGTPPFAYSVNAPQLLEAAGRLLGQLNWHGAVDLDYLLHDDGTYRLLEINPRFSGTVIFAHKMGIDMPSAYLDVVLGKAGESRQSDYTADVMFRTVFPAETNWLLKDWRRVGRSIVNSFHFPARTNLYWQDPRLLKGQFLEAVGVLGKKPKRQS